MRIVFVWFGILVAAIAVAAPAPLPRRERDGAWVAGWDQLVDPTGSCTFHKSGRKLTITSTADREPRLPDPPRLMREVQGDFDATVRLSLPEVPNGKGAQEAGFLVLSEGKMTVASIHVGWTEQRYWTKLQRGWGPKGALARLNTVKQPIETQYLRLTRRGNDLYTGFSNDGSKWTAEFSFGPDEKLAKNVRVGVFVSWYGKAKFSVSFDQFKLMMR